MKNLAMSVVDHPRSRGVYVAIQLYDEWANGSSPLARGLLLRRIGHARQRRIIPARAGFTDREVRRLAVHADHPRSRGGY